MLASPPALSRAFGTLARRLVVRRWAGRGTRDRWMLVLVLANAVAFAYWQTHGPLSGFVRARGPAAGVAAVASTLAALAVAGGALAAWRRATLAARPPGPEWLALPLPPHLVMRHLLAESRWTGAIAFAPALGVELACIGNLSLPWMALLAVAFVPAWSLATRAGAWVAWRARLPRARGRMPLPPATRALLAAERGRRTRRFAPPRWRRESRWRALARLDALVSGRAPSERARLAWAALGFAASLAAWTAPRAPLERRALAFAGFLPACALLGAWAVVRTSSPAEDALAPLPLSWRHAWRARATIVCLLVAGGAVANALGATGFALPARAGLALSWFVAGFAVAVLGLHYAITLRGRATLAEGLYVAWLGLAVVASLMVPLLGWFVLLGGIVHSGLRLPRVSDAVGGER